MLCHVVNQTLRRRTTLRIAWNPQVFRQDERFMSLVHTPKTRTGKKHSKHNMGTNTSASTATISTTTTNHSSNHRGLYETTSPVLVATACKLQQRLPFCSTKLTVCIIRACGGVRWRAACSGISRVVVVRRSSFVRSSFVRRSSFVVRRSSLACFAAASSFVIMLIVDNFCHLNRLLIYNRVLG